MKKPRNNATICIKFCKADMKQSQKPQRMVGEKRIDITKNKLAMEKCQESPGHKDFKMKK